MFSSYKTNAKFIVGFFLFIIILITSLNFLDYIEQKKKIVEDIGRMENGIQKIEEIKSEKKFQINDKVLTIYDLNWLYSTTDIYFSNISFEELDYNTDLDNGHFVFSFFDPEFDEIKDKYKKTHKKLGNELRSFQQKQFPVLREKLADNLNKQFGKDLDIKLKGERNKIINFKSQSFSSDGKINNFHETLKDYLVAYKFKEVEYQASDSGKYYKSFELSPSFLMGNSPFNDRSLQVLNLDFDKDKLSDTNRDEIINKLKSVL